MFQVGVEFDREGLVRGVKIPVGIVGGEQELVVFVDVVQALVELFPVVVGGFFHGLGGEPDVFVDVVGWRMQDVGDFVFEALPGSVQAPGESGKPGHDAPPDGDTLHDLIDQIGSDNLFLFATDYPHWHFDTPEDALPVGLSDNLTQKIMYNNAKNFYRF